MSDCRKLGLEWLWTHYGSSVIMTTLFCRLKHSLKAGKSCCQVTILHWYRVSSCWGDRLVATDVRCYFGHRALLLLFIPLLPSSRGEGVVFRSSIGHVSPFVSQDKSVYNNICERHEKSRWNSETYNEYLLATTTEWRVLTESHSFYLPPTRPSWLYSVSIHQMAHPNEAVHIWYSLLLNLSTSKGWKAEFACSWLTYSRRFFPHKWSPISCRWSIGEGNFVSQRPVF